MRICAGGDQRWSSLPRPHLPVVKIFFLMLTCVKELISSTISLMFVYRKPTMRIPR